jgi:hypothetical protein
LQESPNFDDLLREPECLTAVEMSAVMGLIWVKDCGVRRDSRITASGHDSSRRMEDPPFGQGFVRRQ